MFGEVVILPCCSRVMVPPGAIAKPAPLFKVPDVRLRLVISTEALASRVVLDRFMVNVPKDAPVIPADPDGKVPDPFMIMLEAASTPMAPNVLAKLPPMVRVFPLRSSSPSVWVSVPKISRLSPRVTMPELVLLMVRSRSWLEPLKLSVPKFPVPPMTIFEEAPPTMPPTPVTVPLMVRVWVPITIFPAARLSVLRATISRLVLSVTLLLLFMVRFTSPPEGNPLPMNCAPVPLYTIVEPEE